MKINYSFDSLQKKDDTWAHLAMSYPRAIPSYSTCSVIQSLASVSAKSSTPFVSGLPRDVPNVCKS